MITIKHEGRDLHIITKQTGCQNCIDLQDCDTCKNTRLVETVDTRANPRWLLNLYYQKMKEKYTK